MREAKRVQRESISSTWRKQMTDYLVLMRKCTTSEASAFIDDYVKQNFKSPRIRSMHSKEYGFSEIRTETLNGMSNRVKDKIIMPSGSIYKPTYVKVGCLSALVSDGKAERKVLKKKMLKAKEDNDKIGVVMHNSGQSSVKVRLNSLPGGMGSPFNIFWDKGGYNAITSAARVLIAHSYSTAEQFLGGNWAWFSETEAINHILCVRDIIKPKEAIDACVAKYKLYQPSHQEWFDYMSGIIKQYDYEGSTAALFELISSLEQHEITYLYYMGNLRHVLMQNSETFLPILRDMLTPDKSGELSNIDPTDLYSADEPVMAIVYTILADELAGVKMTELVSGHPELAKLCISVYRKFCDKLAKLDNLFETFLYHDMLTPNILTRKRMYRNTVVISDTDSVIFTAKDWAKWYVGQVDSIVPDSYAISALITCWLVKANEDTMHKYSIAQGATGKEVPIMEMKNEFLYPSLILFDIKKTYAAIVTVQEGVILPSAQPDLKGAQIKGSTLATEAKNFVESFLVDDILIPSVNGKLSGIKLIQKALDFETSVYDSLRTGQKTFLQNKSLKQAGEYANKLSSAWVYAELWNKCYGDVAEIFPPDKLPIVKLLTPSVEFMDNLERTNKRVYTGFMQMRELLGGKYPKSILIPHEVDIIPKELWPIIDVRDSTYKNMKPIYLVFERFMMSAGFAKKQLLLRDMYGVDVWPHSHVSTPLVRS